MIVAYLAIFITALLPWFRAQLNGTTCCLLGYNVRICNCKGSPDPPAVPRLYCFRFRKTSRLLSLQLHSMPRKKPVDPCKALESTVRRVQQEADEAESVAAGARLREQVSRANL